MRRFHAMGADFIKVYNNLRPDVYFAVRFGRSRRGFSCSQSGCFSTRSGYLCDVFRLPEQGLRESPRADLSGDLEHRQLKTPLRAQVVCQFRIDDVQSRPLQFCVQHVKRWQISVRSITVKQ